MTPDAGRIPERVLPGERAALMIGTWPIESGQEVWITYEAEVDGRRESGQIQASWSENAGVNSYWRAELGPFAAGTVVRYRAHGRSPDGDAAGPDGELRTGRPLHLALLWHQHQPLYRDPGHADHGGSYLQPWVRLHALRDYYSMAALVAEHPRLHLTPIPPLDRSDRIATGRQLHGLCCACACVPAVNTRPRARISDRMAGRPPFRAGQLRSSGWQVYAA